MCQIQQTLKKVLPFLLAAILTSCHAIAVLHDADFVTHADRSAPVEWLAATFGPNDAIALLLIAVIALAGALIRVWRRPRPLDTGDGVIEEREETHTIRTRRLRRSQQ
jgi:hypothetical protein